MWGNNETGVIFPVEEAAKLAHEKGFYFIRMLFKAPAKFQ
jgi:cysteine sulfinate desulfinase/cysteine desulfurase-like protein